MTGNADDVIIRPLNAEDSIQELTDLLHRSYKVLADMGFRYVATYQDVATTSKRLGRGPAYVACADSVLVGTITLKRPELTRGSSWYDRADVASFGQFAVSPDYQRCGVGSRLLQTVEATARSWGAAELALDTAEGAVHLQRFYQKRGYRFIEYVDWDVTNYRSVLLSKTL